MNNLWLFVWNVCAHLVASMSGLASFCFSLYEHAKGRKLESRVFFIAGAICLVVAFDQAWQDEHRNATVLIAEKSLAIQGENFWKDQSYQKDAALRARNQLLAQNYTALIGEQGTANKTQSSLAELSGKILDIEKPQKQKTTFLLEGRENAETYLRNKDGNEVAQMLLVTNQLNNPTTVLITCKDNLMASPRLVILTESGGATILSHNQVNASEFRFTVQTPWSPTSPMLIEIPFRDRRFPNCTFETR